MSDEFQRLDKEALTALKARALPRCMAAEIMKVAATGVDPDPVEGARLMKIAGDYFSAFLSPSEKCVCCGWPLGGMMGSFVWGLQNGEGTCRRCHYPARAIHRIGEIGTLSHLIMQYHPDELELR